MQYVDKPFIGVRYFNIGGYTDGWYEEEIESQSGSPPFTIYPNNIVQNQDSPVLSKLAVWEPNENFGNAQWGIVQKKYIDSTTIPDPEPIINSVIYNGPSNTSSITTSHSQFVGIMNVTEDISETHKPFNGLTVTYEITIRRITRTTDYSDCYGPENIEITYMYYDGNSVSTIYTNPMAQKRATRPDGTEISGVPKPPVITEEIVLETFTHTQTFNFDTTDKLHEDEDSGLLIGYSPSNGHYPSSYKKLIEYPIIFTNTSTTTYVINPGLDISIPENCIITGGRPGYVLDENGNTHYLVYPGLRLIFSVINDGYDLDNARIRIISISPSKYKEPPTP